MELRNVEIMKVGTWNGEKFSLQDLKDIVEAYDKVGYKPPVKLGHVDESAKPDEPAYGWVTALRLEGEKLVADFSDIPEKVAAAIREHRYDAVSSEIFFNIKRAGQTFRRALKAVALLGAAIPAVSGLKPLRESFAGLSADDFERVVSFETDHQENAEMEKLKELMDKVAQLTAQIEQNKADPAKVTSLTADLLKTNEAIVALTNSNNATQKALDEANARIAELAAKDRARDIAERSAKCRIPALRPMIAALYSAAMGTETKVKYLSYGAKKDDKEKEATVSECVDDVVAYLNAQAAKLLSESTSGAPRKDEPTTEDLEDPVEIGNEVDRRTKAYAAEKKVDYAAAMTAVFAADPALKAKYAAIGH